MIISGEQVSSARLALLLCFHPLTGSNQQTGKLLPTTNMLRVFFGDLRASGISDVKRLRVRVENSNFPMLPESVDQVIQAILLVLRFDNATMSRAVNRLIRSPAENTELLRLFFQIASNDWAKKLESDAEAVFREFSTPLHLQILDAVAEERLRIPVEVVAEMPDLLAYSYLIASRFAAEESILKLRRGELGGAVSAHRLAIEHLTESCIIRDERLASALPSQPEEGVYDILVRGAYHYLLLPPILLRRGISAHVRCDPEVEVEFDPLWQLHTARALGQFMSDELIIRCMVRGAVLIPAMENPAILRTLNALRDDKLFDWLLLMQGWLNKKEMTAQVIREQTVAWILKS